MRLQIFITGNTYTKDITDPLHTPTGYLMILRRKRKRELRGILSTPPVADAIINSGPREAGANLIQISDDVG